MEKRLKEIISSYFVFLKQYYMDNQEILKSCVKILYKLKLKCIKYTQLKRAHGKNTLFENNNDLSKKAMYFLLEEIDEELNILKEKISAMESLYFKLNNKFVSLGNILNEYTWEEDSYVRIGAHNDQHSLSKVYEYAQDSWTFYLDQLTQVNARMLTLEHTEESLEQTLNTFSQNVNNLTQMDEIITFTQFII